MNLPVTNLDDRSFQQLVDEAKGKIPDFCPTWTNHNVSDPGIALIELFAWMTELAIFRLNQVPDVFYTRMLNLLGFEPFERKAATTDLTFWLTSEALQQPLLIEKGTEVGTVGEGGQPQVFTTMHNLVISQQECKAALTQKHFRGDYTDEWNNLYKVEDNSMVCFPSADGSGVESTPPVPGACFYLGFETSLAGRAIRLSVTASVDGRGIDPDDPPIQWEVWGGESESWIAATIPSHDRFGQPADSTGGLNRDGRLIVFVPDRHERLTLAGNKDFFWLRARLLDSDHQYTESPQLRTLAVATVGGRVPAEHSSTISNEVLGTSNGKPGQVFALARQPLLARDLGDRNQDEVVQVFGNEKEPWIEVKDFVGADENSRSYVLDSASGEVRFGPQIRDSDGAANQRGAIPEIGARVEMKSYRSGGGTSGNVGARTLTGLRSSITFIAAVTNLESATGGVDAESVEDAKQRGPQWLQSGSRAVTTADFERLAQEADRGVARVLCTRPKKPNGSIEVSIVPRIKDGASQHPLSAYELPPSMFSAVSRFIDKRRILGNKVEVRPFDYQGVSVVALIVAKPVHEQKQDAADEFLRLSLISQRVATALYRFVNPLTGGADGNGWPLGANLTIEALHPIIESVEGVKYAKRIKLFDCNLDTGRRENEGKELVRLEENRLFLSANHQVIVE